MKLLKRMFRYIWIACLQIPQGILTSVISFSGFSSCVKQEKDIDCDRLLSFPPLFASDFAPFPPMMEVEEGTEEYVQKKRNGRGMRPMYIFLSLFSEN